MKTMTRGAVAHALQINEVAFVRDDETIEVRSWWRDRCTAVDERESVLHTCEGETGTANIALYPFTTIYGRVWYVGGCASCGKLFYHSIPVTTEDDDA